MPHDHLSQPFERNRTHTPYIRIYTTAGITHLTYIVYIDAGIQVELFLKSAYHTSKLYTENRCVGISNETKKVK